MLSHSAIIVEDFLENPERMRELALAGAWKQSADSNYAGKTFDSPFDPAPLVARLEKLILRPLKANWIAFRVILAGETGRTLVHRDSFPYTLMILIAG